MGWNFTFSIPFNSQDVYCIPMGVSSFVQKEFLDFVENSAYVGHFCKYVKECPTYAEFSTKSRNSFCTKLDAPIGMQ